VELFENEVAFKFLLKYRLDQEHPDFLNPYNCLSDSRVVLDDSVKKLSERFWFVNKRDHNFVVFANL
jgi:hypothetical protein